MDFSSLTAMTGCPVEQDALEYLKKHKVLELLNNLLAQVVFNRPSDPQDFMVKLVQQLQTADTEKENYPCLFDEKNIRSVFNMMDPTGRGFITVKQYQEAMKTLGVEEYQQNITTDKIMYEFFLNEAKLGLIKASTTVIDQTNEV